MDPADLKRLGELSPFDLMEREAGRIDRFYTQLDQPGWSAPTRCAGWDRRDLLAHLAGVEDYTRAGLDGTVADLFARSEASGLNDFNAWQIGQRADLPADRLLSDWRAAAAENRRRLRERGMDGTLDTSVGPYPAGRQGFYLAAELAIHADDAGVPVTDDERAPRQGWLVRFALIALAEVGRDLTVVAADGGWVVRYDGEEYRLDDADFVAAAAARLPANHPLPDPVRRALTVLA